MPQLSWNDQRHLRSFFVQYMRDHPSYPVVIAEGDSWFSFPGHANVIDHLDDLVGRQMALLRLESGGDEAIKMTQGGQFEQLTDYVGQYRPDALLFSGGGNDIVGPELEGFLAPRQAPFDAQAALNTQAMTDRFGAIREAYQRLVRMRDTESPNTVIVTHGYANAIPSGKKAVVWQFRAGPWMRPYLERRGYADENERREVVRALISRFNDEIDGIANGTQKFFKVDARPLIDDNEWNDELHPTRNGFAEVAQQFLTALRVTVPGKFPA